MDDEAPMTPEEAERAHLRGPEGRDEPPFRRMQELRKISRDYPFICPVDSLPHKGSPIGEDPNLDPTFIANHREDDGAHYTGWPMLTCDQCGTRMPQLPVRIEIVREAGPIGLPSSPAHGETVNFTKPYRFCSSDHLYSWAREGRMMICNREPTPFEAGMQPYLPSRHMGGRLGLCDGHHTGPHEWKEAFPG